MNLDQERFLVEQLWQGNIEAVTKLSQIRAGFKRYPEILKWLAQNNVKGEKIIDFFNDAEGVETRGTLRGVKFILNRIDNTKFNKDAMTVKDLK